MGAVANSITILHKLRVRRHIALATLDSLSLQRVLATVGAEIRNHLTSAEAARREASKFSAAGASSAEGILEEWLGVAFVACQVEITRAASEIKKLHDLVEHELPHVKFRDGFSANRQHLMRQGLGDRLGPIEALDAFANYYKHRDQWKVGWPDGKNNHYMRTRDNIVRAGALPISTANMRTGFQHVSLHDRYGSAEELAEKIASWQDDLSNLYLRECGAMGLLIGGATAPAQGAR